MRRSSNVAVSKIAAYAEDPKKFVRSDGGAYNPELARMGTTAHRRIGRGPSKAAFVVTVLLVVAALLYFGIIEI